MTVPTDETYQQSILSRLALTTGEQAIMLQLWGNYADRIDPQSDLVGPRLQALYVEWDLLRGRMTQYQAAIQTQEGDVRYEAQQQFDHVREQATQVVANIHRIEARWAGGNAGGAVAAMVTTSSSPPPPGQVDANDRRYRGSPYDRRQESYWVRRS
jgi:hypothetical protein